ncbi:MAG: substrate-binding domain-containing protein, partial [Chloroflexi bacterium]|nr:substrate-binding domain-containing protein [Chloroflexota bacterium]
MQSNISRWWVLAVLPLLALGLAAACSRYAPQGGAAAPKPDNPEVILATTTSTQDSGLLDVLLPAFERETGYKVKPIAVGSGQAMALGERGEADVLLVHAPKDEARFMQAGHGVERRLVMHNDFIIVGPSADLAGIRGLTSTVVAFQRLAGAGALFLSRGDESGTHKKERDVWKLAGIEPK